MSLKQAAYSSAAASGSAQTGRDPFIWLNYPVNDYGQHNLLMGPVYGNEADIYDKGAAASVSAGYLSMMALNSGDSL